MRPSATDLEQWADRLEARSRLPELVRRLVNSTTADLERPADFPSAEGTQKRGSDGRVVRGSAIPNPFVPGGVSLWELGTNRDVWEKANKDYAKRKLAPPPGIEPQQTTYVFVTPRRFDRKDEWAVAKSGERFWADVRAYDADILEQWLELAPPAAVWLSEVLGNPTDAVSLEQCWREWSFRTSPRTVEALVLAGREAVQEAILRWLRDTPRLLTAETEDPTEAAAVLLATLHRCPPDERAALDRAVVVESDATLRRFVDEGRPMIIVALDCKLELARLAAERHHVVLATRRQLPGERVSLGRADVPAIAAVLERMGFTEEAAGRLANDSHGHLPPLRRLLGDVSKVEVQRDLAPLLLVGSWDEHRPADMEAVLRVLGQGKPELDKLVRRYSLGPEALLRRTGSIWSWVSRMDAWKHLAYAITPDDIDRFGEAALVVLTSADPRFELEPERRFMAPMLDRVLPHSEALREATVECLALLATEGGLSFGLMGEQLADRIVHSVFERLDTWQKWATVGRYLSVLAEASPDIFLRQLEKLFGREPETLQVLVQPQPSVWASERLDDGLVWALETVAWESRLLPMATEHLARLAAAQRAASEGDARALDSLKEIFLPWLPHTSADVSMRQATLRRLCTRRGDVGFLLLLRLLERYDFSTGTRKPRFRQWVAGARAEPSFEDVDLIMQEIGRLLIGAANSIPKRWPLLVPNLPSLHDETRAEALSALERLDIGMLDVGDKGDLRDAIRGLLRHHRMFPDADWALGEGELEKIESLYTRLEPIDVRDRVGWLFDPAAQVPDVKGDDWEEHRRVLSGLREAAARDLASQLSPRAFLEFAHTVKNAALLGAALDLVNLNREWVRELVAVLTCLAHPPARDLLHGLVGAAFQKLGYDCLDVLDAPALSLIARAELAIALPCQAETWSRVEAWGHEAVKHYWRNANHWVFREPKRDLVRALVELLQAARPGQALQLAGMWGAGRHASTKLEPNLVVRILTEACRVGEQNEDLAMTGYHVSNLLASLRSAGPEWRRDLVRLEWAWFPLLEPHYEPVFVFGELQRDPGLFVEMVSWIFRAEDDEGQSATDDELARAHRAFDVLHEWRGLPGTYEGGLVDRDKLRHWVLDARELLRLNRRGKIGDEQIGAVLAHSPPDPDGYWPHEAVRDLFEQLDDLDDIRLGFIIGRRNQRGAYGRGLGEQGEQERRIGADYRRHATELRSRWPVIAGILDSLAERYEIDAQRHDQRGTREKDTLFWSHSTEDRLAAFVDELQASGRYTFSLAEAAITLGRSESEVRPATSTLAQRSRLASPENGFFVIVPLEHRVAAAPPPSWYIDEWMRWAAQSYYVGLLSAAALHGAAHQQPNVFQVVVDKDRPRVKVGRAEIEFVVVENIEGVETQSFKTATGYMSVSTPEATVFDLIRHAESASGGLDRVATVLAELGEEVDGQKLAAVSVRYEPFVVQSAVRILERVGFAERVAQLRTQRQLPETDSAPLEVDVEVDV